MCGLPQTAQHRCSPEHETRFTSKADSLSNLVIELYRRHSSRYGGSRVGTCLDTWKESNSQAVTLQQDLVVTILQDLQWKPNIAGIV